MIRDLLNRLFSRQINHAELDSLHPLEEQESALLRALSSLGLLFYVAAAFATLRNNSGPSTLGFVLFGVIICFVSIYLSQTPWYRLGIMLLVTLTLALVFFLMMTGLHPVYSVGLLSVPILISSMFYRPRTVISLTAASLLLSQLVVVARQGPDTGPLLGIQFFVGGLAIGMSVITQIARQTNLNLLRSQAHFRSVFENMPIPLWEEDFSLIIQRLNELRRSGIRDLEAHLRANPELVDALFNQLRVLDVNQATLKLYDAKDKTELFQKLGSMSWVDNRESYIQQFMAMDARQLSFHLDGMNINVTDADQRKFDLSWQVMTGHESDFSRVLVAIVDVTEKRRAEQQRVDLGIERERVAMLKRFLGDASHDLMTPITVLKSGLYVLQRAVQQQDMEKIPRRIETLESEVQRLEVLIQDMFTLSRLDDPENHQLVFHLQDMNRLLADIVQKFHSLAADHQQQLLLHTGSDPLLVMIDSGNMERALTNLISNALKYTPSGGTIRVRTEAADGQAVIRVQDTGMGISPNDLPHIFERFYRAESHRPTTSGSGLGLAIAHKIVTSHGGVLDVESEEGVGSTFRIKLPLSADGTANLDGA